MAFAAVQESGIDPSAIRTLSALWVLADVEPVIPAVGIQPGLTALMALTLMALIMSPVPQTSSVNSQFWSGRNCEWPSALVTACYPCDAGRYGGVVP